MNKIVLTCAAVCFAFVSFSQGMNELTRAEKKNGTQLLFDGKTFTGWHSFGKGEKVGTSWTIEDGVIGFDAAKKDGGDLVTNESFVNYDFSVDWKISANGNSGIIFNVNDAVEPVGFVKVS